MFVQLSFFNHYLCVNDKKFIPEHSSTLAGLLHWSPTLRGSAACIEIEAIVHMQLEILL